MAQSYTYTPNPRELTKQQLQLPFFRDALETLSTISGNRQRVLPRLHEHASGRRVRSEIHKAIEKLAVPLLRRLDLSTGTLGWADNNGRLRKSNLTQLAMDAGVSPPALSRLLRFFQKVGYVKLETKHLTQRESQFMWSIKSKTAVVFTRAFFRALGPTCYYHYEKAKKWAIKRRLKQERSAQNSGTHPGAQERNAQLKKEAQARKKRNFENWRDTKRHHLMHVEKNRLLGLFVTKHPGVPTSEIRLMADLELARLYPE